MAKGTSNRLIFKDAELARDTITATQKREIAKLYDEWADEIGERAKYYARKTTASSVVSERQMRELQKQLRATSQQVSNEVYKNIKQNIYTVADAVVKSNVSWMKELGFDEKAINAAMSSVPDSVVRNIVTGNIYDSGWSLGQRIWSDNERTLKDIYGVVAKGVAENAPIYDIAKNLEAYVRPNAKMPWNLQAKDGVKIFKKKIDYNAQRLARTLVQHSYQQSFIATTKDNPLILEYEWCSNGSRVCPLCQDRDGQRFKKDELPMDHPNGMCTMIPVVADNLTEQLTNWANSPDGTYLEIDEFAKNFGYTTIPKKTSGVSSVASKVKSYTQKQIQNASKFIKEFGMDAKSTDKYMSTLQGQSREFQNAFVDALKKKVKTWEVSDYDSYYNPGWKKITLDKEAIKAWASTGAQSGKQVLFHEIGHAIDDLAPGSAAKYSKSAKFGFKEAMLKDMKAIDNACKSGDTDYIRGLRTMIKDDSSKGVQDAISAMHCKGIGLGNAKDNVTVFWGHSQEYYERSDAKTEAASELFANMCGAKADPKAQSYMETYFPNASKAFEKIISEIGK